MKNISKTEQGFTLIELMIVVAIIGILAAIAIPQFSNYRTKAFNSAAVSDLHTARLAEESLFADYQNYGTSVAATGTAGAAGAGTIITANGFVATSTSTGTALEEAPVTLSNNVSLAADTDTNENFATITVKHASGDKQYAAETDQSGTFQKSVATTAAFAPIGTATTALDATTAKGYNPM